MRKNENEKSQALGFSKGGGSRSKGTGF